MEQFLNEALRTGQGIGLSDALSTGGIVTGVGLSIVFSVLVILMIVLYLFKLIFYKDPKKTVNKTKTEEVKPQVVETKGVQNDTDEDELIAVLTAAIAASLNTSTYNLKIKSYRRIENNKPAWNRAGINETINSRF